MREAIQTGLIDGIYIADSLIDSHFLFTLLLFLSFSIVIMIVSEYVALNAEEILGIIVALDQRDPKNLSSDKRSQKIPVHQVEKSSVESFILKLNMTVCFVYDYLQWKLEI